MIDMRYEYLYLQCISLYVFVMSRTNFRLNPQSIVVWKFSLSLLEKGAKSEVYATAIILELTIILRVNEHSTNWPKGTKWLGCDVSTYLYNAFDCTFLSCHVRISG